MYPELALFRRPLVIGISFWEIQMGTCLPSSRRTRHVCSRVAACVCRSRANSKARVSQFKVVDTKILKSSETFTAVVKLSGNLRGSLTGLHVSSWHVI